MQKRSTKKMKCDCQGYHFPHRKGSKWCDHYQGLLDDEDQEQRYFDIRKAV